MKLNDELTKALVEAAKNVLKGIKETEVQKVDQDFVDLHTVKDEEDPEQEKQVESTELEEVYVPLTSKILIDELQSIIDAPDAKIRDVTSISIRLSWEDIFYKFKKIWPYVQQMRDAAMQPNGAKKVKDIAKKAIADVRKYYPIKESTQLDEKLKPSDDIKTWIDDFIKSDDPQFDGKSKEERIKMAIGAYYGAQKNEGNEFTKAAAKAALAGEKEFEFDGETYPTEIDLDVAKKIIGEKKTESPESQINEAPEDVLGRMMAEYDAFISKLKSLGFEKAPIGPSTYKPSSGKVEELWGIPMRAGKWTGIFFAIMYDNKTPWRVIYNDGNEIYVLKFSKLPDAAKALYQRMYTIKDDFNIQESQLNELLGDLIKGTAALAGAGAFGLAKKLASGIKSRVTTSGRAERATQKTADKAKLKKAEIKAKINKVVDRLAIAQDDLSNATTEIQKTDAKTRIQNAKDHIERLKDQLSSIEE